MNWMNFLNDMRALSPDDPAGNGDPAGDPPAADAGDPPPAGDPTVGDPPAEPNFDWLPEQFRGESGPDFEAFQAHYSDLAAESGIRAEALEKVPENADGYDLNLPDDLDYGEIELPEGYAVQINLDDENMAPVFSELREFMHENKLPAEAGQKVMGMLAKYEARQYAQAMQAANEQLQQLGPQGGERIAKVSRAIESKLSEGQAKALKSALSTADGVRALETLLAPRSNGAPVVPKPKAPADDLEAYYANPTR